MAVNPAAVPPPRQALVSGSPGRISRRRRVKNQIWWWCCGIGLALLVAPVAWVLYGVLARGISGWRWDVIWTPTIGIGGGLSGAIVGTFVITFGVAVIAGVIGVGGGIFLAEFCRPGVVATVLRSSSEVLSGVPSIVFGYVGYVALVIGLRWKFSLLAAWIVLSMLVVPYVAKSTELALNQVPLAYREGGEALGMERFHVLRRLVLRSAVPGMLTGLVVAIAISIGETAPLLYTAGSSTTYPTVALIHSPVGYLTSAVWTDYESPFPVQHALANDAALILVVLVVALIVGSRLVVRATQRYAPNRALAASTRRPRRPFRRSARRQEIAGLFRQTAAPTDPDEPPQ
ncbi:MAG TPA: phosphate ABC transporter permease PstA [Acidimicrobiales bacterium]|nr:phosphate ABC transporter permease PstA [Acidimicrobiales bacterium]